MKKIAQLVDGDASRVRGRIRGGRPEPLTSPLGELACVYWDIRPGWDAPPEQKDAQAFWVEDPSGKVLVPVQDVEIVARGTKKKTLVETAAADIHSVSNRIRELKDQLRTVQGAPSKPLLDERARLAKVATLLCAIKAHARGNLHLDTSLKDQERFIEANKGLIARDGLGSETLKMMVQRLEVVLCDGDQVEVEGIFRVEPMPPDIGGAQGYRERSTCLMLRPDEDGKATVRGIGRAAPVPEDEVEVPSPAPAPMRVHPPPHRDPIVRATAFIVAVVTVAYYLLR